MARSRGAAKGKFGRGAANGSAKGVELPLAMAAPPQGPDLAIHPALKLPRNALARWVDGSESKLCMKAPSDADTDVSTTASIVNAESLCSTSDEAQPAENIINFLVAQSRDTCSPSLPAAAIVPVPSTPSRRPKSWAKWVLPGSGGSRAKQQDGASPTFGPQGAHSPTAAGFANQQDETPSAKSPTFRSRDNADHEPTEYVFPEDDDYDPAKPEYIMQISKSEAAEATARLQLHQAARLESFVASRRKSCQQSTSSQQLLDHYSRVAGDLQVEAPARLPRSGPKSIIWGGLCYAEIRLSFLAKHAQLTTAQFAAVYLVLCFRSLGIHRVLAKFARRYSQWLALCFIHRLTRSVQDLDCRIFWRRCLSDM